MPKVKINGFEIYYEISGEGIPLVMIIGLGANSEWWGEDLINQLSNTFKVMILDNRGTGRSDVVAEEFTMKDLAEDVVNLMDKVNIQKAYILGVSMGGMIAQEVALNFPEKVIKLVLCSTSCGGTKFIPPGPEVQKILLKPREGRSRNEITEETILLLYTEDFIKSYANQIEEAKENMNKYPISDQVYELQGKALFKHNTCRKLKNLTIPTLIMQGKKDVLMPSKNAEVLHELIPNSELAMFENTAHALFAHETDKVLSRLIEFLEK